MKANLPEELNNRANRPVLEQIQHLSTPSDLADPFQAALKPLGEVRLFCPDWENYRYVAAATNHIVLTSGN
jgi:hypothetical protein